MPADFDKCRQNGGKLRTISGPNKEFGLGPNEYMHICIINGQIHRGEKKLKKEIARRAGA